LNCTGGAGRPGSRPSRRSQGRRSRQLGRASAAALGLLLLAGCSKAATVVANTTTSSAATTTTVANTTTTFTLAPGTRLPPGPGGKAMYKACAVVGLLFSDVFGEAPFPIPMASALASQAFSYARTADVDDGNVWHPLAGVILDLDDATVTIAWSHGNGQNSNIITTAYNDCTPVEAGKLP